LRASCGSLRSSGPGAAFTLSLLGTSRAVGWRCPVGAAGMLPEGSVDCAKATAGATSAAATRRDRTGCLRPKALVVMTFPLARDPLGEFAVADGITCQFSVRAPILSQNCVLRI